MRAVKNQNDEIIIICDGQVVLKIGEVSDIDTINLFLTPTKGSTILETDNDLDMDKHWTHELLGNRTYESKRIFDANQPLYMIV